MAAALAVGGLGVAYTTGNLPGVPAPNEVQSTQDGGAPTTGLPSPSGVDGASGTPTPSVPTPSASLPSGAVPSMPALPDPAAELTAPAVPTPGDVDLNSLRSYLDTLGTAPSTTGAATATPTTAEPRATDTPEPAGAGRETPTPVFPGLPAVPKTPAAATPTSPLLTTPAPPALATPDGLSRPGAEGMLAQQGIRNPERPGFLASLLAAITTPLGTPERPTPPLLDLLRDLASVPGDATRTIFDVLGDGLAAAGPDRGGDTPDRAGTATTGWLRNILLPVLGLGGGTDRTPSPILPGEVRPQRPTVDVPGPTPPTGGVTLPAAPQRPVPGEPATPSPTRPVPVPSAPKPSSPAPATPPSKAPSAPATPTAPAVTVPPAAAADPDFRVTGGAQVPTADVRAGVGYRDTSVTGAVGTADAAASAPSLRKSSVAVPAVGSTETPSDTTSGSGS